MSKAKEFKAGVTQVQFALVGVAQILEDVVRTVSLNFFNPSWGLQTLGRFQRNNIKQGYLEKED